MRTEVCPPMASLALAGTPHLELPRLPYTVDSRGTRMG